MGQYWLPVNLDRREFIDPHKLGNGLKLWEQVASAVGSSTALLILTAAMPEARGGGDLDEDPVIGRWAGNRIALIGDYAEAGDIAKCNPTVAPVIPDESRIYGLCRAGGDPAEDDTMSFVDITDLVLPIIERELGGRFHGEGWREFRYNDEK